MKFTPGKSGNPNGRPKGLTQRQQRFVDEYLLDLNGTQAAIRAGYSPQTAQQMATENLSKPLVKAAVDLAIANRVNRVQVKQDAVVRSWCELRWRTQPTYSTRKARCCQFRTCQKTPVEPSRAWTWRKFTPAEARSASRWARCAS